MTALPSLAGRIATLLEAGSETRPNSTERAIGAFEANQRSLETIGNQEVMDDAEALQYAVSRGNAAREARHRHNGGSSMSWSAAARQTRLATADLDASYRDWQDQPLEPEPTFPNEASAFPPPPLSTKPVVRLFCQGKGCGKLICSRAQYVKKAQSRLLQRDANGLLTYIYAEERWSSDAPPIGVAPLGDSPLNWTLHSLSVVMSSGCDCLRVPLGCISWSASSLLLLLYAAVC